MPGLQASTAMALLMLLRLHLKESLPTFSPATDNFTHTPQFTSTPYATNSSTSDGIHGEGGSAASAINFNIVTIVPNDDNAKFQAAALVMFSGKSTTIKLLASSNSSLDPLSSLQITFTKTKRSHGADCDDIRDTPIFEATLQPPLITSTISLLQSPQVLYICLRVNSSAGGKTQFVHQGDGGFMRLMVLETDARQSLLPLWLQVILIIILLFVSGLFSGLNLGLMSLDKTELNIMIASGSRKEKQYAKTILPLRKRGNYLLCTILLGNVLVNNCLTILLDDLTGSGISAILTATFAIVLFGEIIPQAVCSRYGLAVGARTSWFTKFFMLVTFPLSFPISMILDRILGEEIGQVYNRDRLRELLKLTEKDMDLQLDEFNIITGALDLSKKNVKEIMTKLDDVYMIENTAILDFSTVSKIMESGYTRVPIYDKDRSNIVALLNVKDLALVDPDNKVELRTVTQFYKHNVLFVFEDTKLDVILSDFKKGGSHMAMVQTVYSEGLEDPYYVVTGLVTLEDVIEEIIQAEIYDEFDTITDNIRKEPRLISKKDWSIFQQLPTAQNIPRFSPQLKLAAFQYFTAQLLPFKTPYVTERILNRLLNQNILVIHTYNENIPCYLFQHSRPCDYFVFIVEGRVEVQCGKENLTYEAGPFSYFGSQALLVPSFRNPNSVNTDDTKEPEEPSWVLPSTPFVPDYSVKIITNLKYVKIRRDQYAVAHRASKYELGLSPMGSSHEQADELFERDWRFNNQMYVVDVREDRLRKQMKHPSMTQNSLFGTTSILQNLRRTFGRPPLSPEFRSFLSSEQRGPKHASGFQGPSVEGSVIASFHSTKPSRTNSVENIKVVLGSPRKNQAPPYSISPVDNQGSPSTLSPVDNQASPVTLSPMDNQGSPATLSPVDSQASPVTLSPVDNQESPSSYFLSQPPPDATTAGQDQAGSSPKSDNQNQSNAARKKLWKHYKSEGADDDDDDDSAAREILMTEGQVL